MDEKWINQSIHLANVESRQIGQKIIADKKRHQDPVVQKALKVKSRHFRLKDGKTKKNINMCSAEKEINIYSIKTINNNNTTVVASENIVNS